MGDWGESPTSGHAGEAALGSAPDTRTLRRQHDGDDIFPVTARLVPLYRVPIVLAGLVAAVIVSQAVPPEYPGRTFALTVHNLSLVLSFGSVLLVDWHGLLWLAGRRSLRETTRLAAAAGPVIWLGLAGLIASGALLRPDLASGLVLLKLGLVLAVAWNGAALSAVRHRRLARLPADASRTDIPRGDWRRMTAAMVISQVGWWGAITIGFVTSSA